MSRRAKIVLATILLSALFFGTFKPGYYRILTADRTTLRDAIEKGPDSRAPGYDDFLAGVGGAVPRGASVALLIPDKLAIEESDYRFYRASWFLAGRYVRRMSARELSPVSDIGYIVLWPGDRTALPFEPILEQGGGTLFERK